MWLGADAERRGLDDSVAADGLQAVLAGLAPGSGGLTPDAPSPRPPAPSARPRLDVQGPKSVSVPMRRVG